MLSHFSCASLFGTLWTVVSETPLFMGFSKQGHRSGLPCPPPGTLPNPGIELTFLMSSALAGRFFITGATWEAQDGDSYTRRHLSKTFQVPEPQTPVIKYNGWGNQ